MDGYDESTYGEGIAAHYDLMYGDPQPAQIDLLEELAAEGPVLELGIGTGRIALPLGERGINVHGIDGSEAMVARLREKPGGVDLPVLIGDFSRFELGEHFHLIFVAFNTFFGLLTQDDQISCFEAVAQHLDAGGAFLMEAFVPDLARFDRGQRTGVSEVATDHTVIEVAIHHPVAQRVDAQHLFIENGAPVQILPVSVRYAWPSELDLMARLAGLELRHRWSDWDRSPFNDDSTKHISVWGQTPHRS